MVRWFSVVLAVFAWCGTGLGDEDRLRSNVEFMAGQGSRISGYPGAERTADFLLEKFRLIGLEQITEEEFPLAVPVDRGGELVVAGTGERFPIYGLWPNQARTTTLPGEGLDAQLVYGGKGVYREFNGAELDSSVVLMEFNSWNYWLRAGSLGARAVVFIEPEETTWRQAEEKFTSVPLDLPRFWIGREAGIMLRESLKKGELTVHLQSRMDWEQRVGRNIWGVIPGSDPGLADETIIVEAYYDGISVVPALAPSAEMASSAAALLELAYHLKEQRPARPVIMVATGGHFLGQRGIVDFLDRHARKEKFYAERMEQPLSPRLFISLDLSSQTDQVGIWNNTDSYDLKRFFVPFGRRFTAYVEEVAPLLGRDPELALVNGISPIKGMDWSTFVPGGVLVNSQTALQAGLVSLGFVTVHDYRLGIDSPLDLPEKVRFDNLERQSRLLNGIFSMAFSDPDLFSDLEDFGPVLKDKLRDLRVKVRAFPRRSQVPDRPIEGAIVSVGRGKSHKGVRTIHQHITDRTGNVKIPGLPIGGVPVSAYAFDDESGEISYAPDLNIRAQKFHGGPVAGWMLSSAIRWQTNEKTIVVFPCISREFYSLIDPRLLSPLGEIKVIDRNGVAPRQFGIARGGMREPVGVIFGSPDEVEENGIKLLMGGRMLLLNSEGGQSEDEARGKGYSLVNQELTPTNFLAVRDMWRLNEARLHTMRAHAIENQRLTRLHERGRELLKKAEKAEEERNWEQYISYVRAALGVTSRAYPEVVSTLNDVIRGIVFFLALVIPAAFFGERLLFAAADIRRQLAGFAALLLAIWLVISQVHPAFAIAHPLVILLAFAIMAMAILVLLMITSRFNRYMREYQAKEAHIHETDISRASASYAAFILGISNMRRRKMRTGLTLLTLVLLTFTVLSFTSFNSQVRYMAFKVAHEGVYEGALIRDRGWNRLAYPTFDYAFSHFGEEGVVSPRGWYISFDKEQKKFIEVKREGKIYRSTGLLGLSHLEPQVTGVDRALTAGRFFARSDEASCLLSEEMGRALGVGPGDVGKGTVQVFGKELKIAGLFDAETFSDVVDLDNEPLTPADFQMSSSQALGPVAVDDMAVMEEDTGLQIRPFVHLESENVLILPYEVLREIGGDLRSVAIRFDKGAAGQDLIEDFLVRLAITLFAGLRDPGEAAIKVFSYTSVGMTAVEGLGALIIPMFIAALIVLNAMMGAVYERFREIGIYSSVGLAPLHIALLFVAEACVYAVIGVTLGYLLGQGLGKILIWLDLLEGMNLNYSSMSAIVSSLLVMAVVLLSTIYPAKVAAKSAVPDTVRRWSPPPPEEGDGWSFDFPFMVSEAEVMGICGFLANFFNAYSEESIGDFFAEKVRIVEEMGETGKEYGVQLLLWLAPFDMGVSQFLQLEFLPTDTAGVYTVQIYIQRISGQDTFWQRINHRFFNRLRKEFLIWHTLKDEAREYHRGVAEKLLADFQAENPVSVTGS
jgi:hypothetical protein